MIHKHNFEHLTTEENFIINQLLKKLDKMKNKGLITKNETYYTYITSLQEIFKPAEVSFIFCNSSLEEIWKDDKK